MAGGAVDAIEGVFGDADGHEKDADENGEAQYRHEDIAVVCAGGNSGDEGEGPGKTQRSQQEREKEQGIILDGIINEELEEDVSCQ